MVLERSESLTYLGEIIHKSGLKASVSATVDLRVGQVQGAIFKIKALCEDYRMQICGGMVCAINLLEACSAWCQGCSGVWSLD